MTGKAERGGAAPSSGAAPARRRGLSLSSRLAATVLGVGLTSLAGATLVGLNAGESLGRSIVDDGLESLRSSGSTDVAAQLGFYERLAEQLAASPQTTASIEGFASALAELSSTPDDESRLQRQELIEGFRDQYIEPAREEGEVVQLREILSDDPAAVYLQAAYSLPDGPIREPIAVDDAGDGSAWTDLHSVVHPVYRNAVLQAGLLDILLVDLTSGRIVYSASKAPDLGTSLAVGPYSGSIVARATDAAAASEGDGVVTDLSYYRALPGVPVGAAAAQVRDGDRLVGAVVLTYDAGVYTERLSSLVDAAKSIDEGEEDLGMYLIGAGGTTRSDPQSYLADPQAFLDASTASGVLTEAQRTEIELRGTTVLVQPAADGTGNAAVDGESDVMQGTSMTGGDVVGVVDRVPVDDVAWYTVAEADLVEAEATISTFRQILLVGAAVFLVALAFVAVAWAKRFMRPVLVISDRLGRSARAKLTTTVLEPVAIPDRSPVEFHRLADAFGAMGQSLQRQQLDLRDARAERLDVLEGMLPPSIAQRLAGGDIDSLDEVERATVAVVVVLGLGALVRADADGGDRRVLDDLNAEMDDIAAVHGLERIKVVGDSYFGACGHDRPYIDHAARAVAFATDVAAAVTALSRRSSVPLDTAIGINTGPVTVGMSGGTRLVFDVWGPTVTTAHQLARAAGAGEIVATDATLVRLPDAVTHTRWHPDAPRADGTRAGGPSGELWSLGVDRSSNGTPAQAQEVR